ncbi:MAG: twin-arginine translocase subunit TatB [Alphaproteobacteria bacterium]|nr:twin-arginine translocase subunit TatB [Alphaproteobacteria bacterium]
MFDIGWSELLVIGVVALVVVGPRDLPKMMRGAAQWVRALRRMAGDLQHHVDDLMRESELDELRREVHALRTGKTLAPSIDRRSPPPAGDGLGKAATEIAPPAAVPAPAPGAASPSSPDMPS